MDKFERVQQYCVNGDLAIKSEGMEDTFKDIAVYSTLAMILFRKEQDEALEHSTQRKPSTKAGAKTESLFTPQVPLNIDDDCLGTPKLKFKNKNVSNN